MLVYEGSPRQDWEEVLRCVGAWADREYLKELLFLELEGGFLVQGLASSQGGHWSESGTYSKHTHELTDDQIGELMAAAHEQRGTSGADHPEVGVANFYEQALRIIGKWIDGQHPQDVFFFEQGGSFVVRTYVMGAHGKVGHELSEFTREEIVAMIEAAPGARGRTTPPAEGSSEASPAAGGSETEA